MIDLAVLYIVKGETEKAIQTQTRAMEIRERQLALVIAIGSEAEKRDFIATLADDINITLTLHLHYAPNSSQAQLTFQVV